MKSRMFGLANSIISNVSTQHLRIGTLPQWQAKSMVFWLQKLTCETPSFYQFFDLCPSFCLFHFANLCFISPKTFSVFFLLAQWIQSASQELLGYNLRFRKVSGVLTELLALSGCSSQDLDQCTFPTEHVGLEVWSTILDTGDWKDISKQLGGASAVLLGSIGYTGCWDLLSEGVYTKFDCAYCSSDMLPLCLCICAIYFHFIETCQIV